MPYYKITDDEEEIKVLKTLNENITNTKDGKNLEMSSDLVAYNIITTSDKVINGRIYPDAYVKITALEDRWVQRFAKPFLVNHDIYTEALGRVCDAVHYNHKDETQVGGKEKIPLEVLDYFKLKKCFDEGTGSIIGKILITKETADKIKSSVFFTTSQSSATDGYICNICGSNYFECNHCSGNVYEKDGSEITCIPSTKDLYPIENSSVNSPANDTSILILFNTKNKKIVLNSVDEIMFNNNEEQNSEKNDSKFDKNKKLEDNAKIQDNAIKKNEEEKTMPMTEDQLLAGLERIKASDTASFEKTVTSFCGEEASKDMKATYKKISDESLSLVNSIVEDLTAISDKKTKELEGKLKEAEDKLKAAEEKIATLETATTQDNQENQEGDGDTTNPKVPPVVAPETAQDEETVAEDEIVEDFYSAFTIKSKKGGK